MTEAIIALHEASEGGYHLPREVHLKQIALCARWAMAIDSERVARGIPSVLIPHL